MTGKRQAALARMKQVIERTKAKQGITAQWLTEQEIAARKSLGISQKRRRHDRSLKRI